MNKNAKHISKPTYYFSLLTWVLNVFYVVIPFFFDISGLWFVAFFASVLFQGAISGAFYDETLVPKMTKPYKVMDYCLIASKYVSISLATVSFISLLIGGGGPEIMDEAYCLVNHGEIVRYLSIEWFIYFSVCDMLLFSCGILFFSTYMAMRVRALYCIQNSTAQ